MFTTITQGVLAENSLEIFTPPPFISAQTEHLHIVGKTNAPIVEVILNSEKLYDLLVKDSIFHASLSFGYGVNAVRMIPIYSGESEVIDLSAKIEIMYGPDVSRKYKKIFTPYFYHKAENREACYNCHMDFKISTDSLSSDAGCLDCHKDLATTFKKHTKVENKTCINCHQLNILTGASKTRNITETNLCYSCHTDKIGQFAQDYIHGPVAGGSCVICHEPHGSQFDKNLVNPQQILCFSCHVDLEEEMEMRVVHNPFKNGQCSVCHDPHSTSNKWVLVKSSEKVCLGCHNPDNKSMQWHSHPFNVKPKRKLKVNVELNNNGNLECISCHYPHGTNSEHLLRIDEEFTCIGCHTDVL